MPNYNIVVNTSNFKPFSFQDKIAPLILYNQSYDQLNEKLEKYAEDYGSIPETNNAEIDGVVNDYNNRLRELSDRFANGMTNSVGNDLRKMFIEGKQKLTPIKQAISDYNDYVDKVEKLGPDAIFKKQYSIEDFYNKQRSPLEYKSASDIQKQAKDYFTGLFNLSKEAPRVHGTLSAYYDIIQTNPYNFDIGSLIGSLDNIKNNLLYNENEKATADKIQKGISDFYRSQNVSDWDSQSQERVFNSIQNGLMSAIEAPDYDIKQTHSFSGSSYGNGYSNDGEIIEIGDKTYTKSGKYWVDKQGLPHTDTDIVKKIEEMSTIYTKNSDGEIIDTWTTEDGTYYTNSSGRTLTKKDIMEEQNYIINVDAVSKAIKVDNIKKNKIGDNTFGQVKDTQLWFKVNNNNGIEKIYTNYNDYYKDMKQAETDARKQEQTPLTPEERGKLRYSPVIVEPVRFGQSIYKLDEIGDRKVIFKDSNNKKKTIRGLGSCLSAEDIKNLDSTIIDAAVNEFKKQTGNNRITKDDIDIYKKEKGEYVFTIKNTSPFNGSAFEENNTGGMG